jgi:hypothetical protein
LNSVAPYSPPSPKHPADVATLSPSFVEIHGQANAAEYWRLDQIAGVGYRKALEFLVKDYCSKIDPTKAEAIKAKQLGEVIKDHIGDANIQECARRPAWLGNDETHYVRLWTDKDVKDLKALINLTESWINTHPMTQQYRADMPEPKK